MSLIICACNDTEENGRSEYTRRTLENLCLTVDWKKHRLIVVDNGSCAETKAEIKFVKDLGSVITLPENVGTARAINFGMKLRQPEENVIKVDNDVVIHQSGWLEEMEEVIARDESVGIVGLKRKDIDFDGQMIRLPHVAGQRWITVERGGNIMGTCTMLNWRLVDKIGGMVQPGLYGFDDCLYCLRAELSGFWNCYLPHINIDHIDPGGNKSTTDKHAQAGAVWDEYHAWHKGYIDGTRPLFEEP